MAKTLPDEVSKAALNAGLPQSSVSDLVEAASGGSKAAMEKVPGITEKIMLAAGNAVKIAYSESFRTVFLVSIAFGGLSTIAALLSVSVDDKLDNLVAAKLSGAGASQERLRSEDKD